MAEPINWGVEIFKSVLPIGTFVLGAYVAKRMAERRERHERAEKNRDRILAAQARFGALCCAAEEHPRPMSDVELRREMLTLIGSLRGLVRNDDFFVQMMAAILAGEAAFVASGIERETAKKMARKLYLETTKELVRCSRDTPSLTIGAIFPRVCEDEEQLRRIVAGKGYTAGDLLLTGLPDLAPMGIRAAGRILRGE